MIGSQSHLMIDHLSRPTIEVGSIARSVAAPLVAESLPTTIYADDRNRIQVVDIFARPTTTMDQKIVIMHTKINHVDTAFVYNVNQDEVPRIFERAPIDFPELAGRTLYYFKHIELVWRAPGLLRSAKFIMRINHFKYSFRFTFGNQNYAEDLLPTSCHLRRIVRARRRPDTAPNN